MAGPTCVLTGVDGQTWEFGDPRCPVRLWYVRGLEGAPFDMDTTVGVGQPGVSFVARNDKPNLIEIGANVGPVDAGDFAVSVLRAWRKSLGRATSLQPGGPLGRFTVIETGRFQMVRLAEKLPAQYEQMANVGWVREEPKLQSDESWWRLDPITQEFTAAQFSTAAVISYGSVPSWPHYRLTGPITSPKLGLGGELISLPNIAAGDFLEIETDPDWWEITNAAGVDKSYIGDRWHKLIPGTFDESGVSVPIGITGTGSTSATRLSVTFPQRFESAL